MRLSAFRAYHFEALKRTSLVIQVVQSVKHPPAKSTVRHFLVVDCFDTGSYDSLITRVSCSVNCEKTMAKVMAKFPPQAAIPGKYPWDVWMNGKIWRVGPEDDICHSFRTMLYMQARKTERRVTTSADGDDVIFRFYFPKEEAAKKRRDLKRAKAKAKAAARARKISV